MKKYFVYLLKSQKDNKFYIGQTKNVLNRLTEHNSGQVPSTKYRIPFKLIGYSERESRQDAIKLEKKLKSHSDQKIKFIRKFIPDFEWKIMRA